MFPGVILHMTYWYRPDEMSVRLLYFCKLEQVKLRVEIINLLDRHSRKPVGYFQRPPSLCIRHGLRKSRPVWLAVAIPHRGLDDYSPWYSSKVSTS